ncbi:MAG: UDP-glucose 4-epimerase GalE, partial [Roseibacillus sp.]
VGGGLSLLEAMVAAQVPKIVFSSTCATYGIPESVPIDESVPQRPVNPYGHSKLTFECMLHWFGEAHGLSSVMFRYFNAAGASRQFGEHHRIETHLIPNVLFAAQGRRKEIEIYGTDYDTPDGTAVRDYVHVSDLAEIHKQAVEEDVTGAFNLGTGQGHSVREVIEACEKATGREIPVRDCPRRPGDPPVLVAATGKAVREWGWAPRFSDLEKTVRSAWEWHEAHPEGYAD